ncbi:hypothetical protein GGR50DRAFT_494895 [Xylaria sp. CBS 124048]|nr:hypothetical protein GGR50DRAFT_494895 [Xylaria sp. CBS 124048]
MFYRRITPILAAVGVALTPGTWASDIGLVDRRLQEDVGMSLFPRQDELGLNNLNVCTSFFFFFFQVTRQTLRGFIHVDLFGVMQIFTDTLGGAEAPPVSLRPPDKHVRRRAIAEPDCSWDDACNLDFALERSPASI